MYKNLDEDHHVKLPLDVLLIFGRCRRPRRSAASVATCDGEAVQYVSGENIDHVAGKDKPQSAAKIHVMSALLLTTRRDAEIWANSLWYYPQEEQR